MDNDGYSYAFDEILPYINIDTFINNGLPEPTDITYVDSDESIEETNSPTYVESNTVNTIPHKSNNYKCVECDTVAVYGTRRSNPEYCAQHKPTYGYNVTAVLCECGRIPHYGIDKRVTCSECKLPEHRILDTRVCPCGKYASYGPIGGRRLTCAKCKEPEYVLLSRKLCEKCNKKPAQFGLVDGKKIVCRNCKEPHHVDLATYTRCEKCNSKAEYRLPGCRVSRCEKHRTAKHRTK